MSLEEADRIQIMALNSAGIVLPSAVKSASTFTPEALCEALVKCLRLINPEDEGVRELPDKLPGNVAARHRMATAVAKLLKSAGFSQGEVGYNQLLYPNEKDVRRLISWAVQRLPRSDSGSGGSSGVGKATTPLSLVLQKISSWTQPRLRSSFPQWNGTGNSVGALAALEGLQVKCGCSLGAGREGAAKSKAVREAALSALRNSSLELVSGEVEAATLSGTGVSRALPLPARVGAALALADPSSLSSLPQFALPSWEELLSSAPSSMGSVGPRHFPGTHLDALSSAFNRRAVFAVRVERRAGGGLLPSSPSPQDSGLVSRMKTEEEITREREEEINALNSRLEVALKDTEALTGQRAALSAALPSLVASLAAALNALGDLERGYALRSSCLAMLPDAQANLERLSREIEERGGELARLAGEWERVRAPLAGAIHHEEGLAAAAASKLESLLAELAKLRGDMGGMAASAAAKDEAVARMEAEVARITGAGGETGPPSRTNFSSQISAITAGVRKQKGEISRIVGDVKALQLELAAVGDGLRRIAGVALETMERSAKENIKEPNYREAFKQLLKLQDLFGEILLCTTNSGAAVNEARDLENRIINMQQRNDAVALVAVERDLAAVRAENAAFG